MRSLAAALLCSAALTVPASAAVMTTTFAVQADGFTRFAGTGSNTPAFASLSGQFTITFDTNVNSSGVVSTEFGLPTPYGVGLNYTYQSGLDRINISQTPSSNQNDGPFPAGSIYFSIQGASTATPSIRRISGFNMIVTNTAFDAQYNPSNASVSIVPQPVGAVPEPATWAMMIGGFGLVGSAMRRRQKTAITFA